MTPRELKRILATAGICAARAAIARDPEWESHALGCDDFWYTAPMYEIAVHRPTGQQVLVSVQRQAHRAAPQHAHEDNVIRVPEERWTRRRTKP
jgi:hypothetical protein